MAIVNFKVYLCRPGEEMQEVRRFGMKKSMSSSFTAIQEKLCAVFPDLEKETFAVKWKDQDDDDVTISSDEELMIALAEMKGDLYKLHVSVKSQCSASTDGRCPFEGKEKGEKHPGIVCDSCDDSIHGYRYKCLQCVDYDLCSDCERKGLHSDHNMIRIPTPSMWCPNFGRRLHRMQARMQQRAAANEEETAENKEETAADNWGHFAFRRGGCKGPRGRGAFRGHGDGFGPWKFCRGPWSAMMSGWMGPTAAENNEGGQTSEAKAKNECTTKEGNGPEGQAKFGEAPYYNEDFLKNVGQSVAAFLDPMGIDVQVDIEHNGHHQTCSAKSDEVQKPKNDEKTKDTGKAEMSNEAETGEKIIIKDREYQNIENDERHDTSLSKDEPTSEGEKNKMADKSCSPSDGEDWTVVDEVKSPDQSNTSTTAKGNDDTEPKTVVNPKQSSVYPGLPAVEPTAPSHPDPRIQDALQKMMTMGFTNEGGWLTQLLEVKQGDIGKVLDILQPVKPYWKKA